MNRVTAVVNLLADDESKRIYLSAVKYRQTGKLKHHPYKSLTRKIKEYDNDKFLSFINKLYHENMEHDFNRLNFNDQEVYLDCGSNVGNSIDLFIKYCPNYKQIFAFEPDPINVEKLKERHGDNPLITIIPDGVYDKDGEIFISGSGDVTSHVLNDDKGGIAVRIKAIDNLNIDKVTYIKMDIEGAELKALKEAEKTILRDKPKMKIAIYHGNEDMIGIIEYINKLVPVYKLYISQYNIAFGTTLWAIPNKQ
jgi:FkbM family methyltransferase